MSLTLTSDEYHPVIRILDDDIVLAISDRSFGQWTLHVSTVQSWLYGSYNDGWVYPCRTQALSALMMWVEGNEEPEVGWVRNFKSGRRRDDGDSTKEYIQR